MTNIKAINRLDALRRENPMLVCADVQAIDMAIAALEKQYGKKPYPDNDISILACPYCGSGEYLHNSDENRNLYCGQFAPPKPQFKTNIYDQEEIHHGCTVQILRNSVTGNVSVGWWKEKEEKE